MTRDDRAQRGDVRGRPRPTDPRAHRWVNDACATCGLRRRELWTLDDRHRPVMALLWWHPRVGPIAVRRFAYMLGHLPPDDRPLRTMAEQLPGVPVGSEPGCRG